MENVLTPQAKENYIEICRLSKKLTPEDREHFLWMIRGILFAKQDGEAKG